MEMIMRTVADGGEDLDVVLEQYLEGPEKGEQGEKEKLRRLLKIFNDPEDRHELVDGIVIHAWKYVEKHPNVWHHRYETLDELKHDIGYVETVLPCMVRQTDWMKRLEREKQTVLKHWNVCCSGGVANSLGPNLRGI
jgi:hypothetical protein